MQSRRCAKLELGGIQFLREKLRKIFGLQGGQQWWSHVTFSFFQEKKIKVGTFYHFIFVKLELTKDLCYYVNKLDNYS
jgi:hypothetical protein